MRRLPRQRQTVWLREQISAAYADGLDAEELALLEVHRRLQRSVVEANEW